MSGLRLGTAGWAIPRAVASAFPAEGAGLERYAARFNAVEINASFYRSPRPGTYERWARITPAGFRFAMKAPRTITHHAKLAGCEGAMARFLSEVSGLGEKLGPILVQLPPSHHAPLPSRSCPGVSCLSVLQASRWIVRSWSRQPPVASNGKAKARIAPGRLSAARVASRTDTNLAAVRGAASHSGAP
jgi:hypothetical protein